jgi:hypothetical protein
VFQRAIAIAGVVDGHNLQVLIQAAHPWAVPTGQGAAIAFREWRDCASEQIAP